MRCGENNSESAHNFGCNGEMCSKSRKGTQSNLSLNYNLLMCPLLPPLVSSLALNSYDTDKGCLHRRNQACSTMRLTLEHHSKKLPILGKPTKLPKSKEPKSYKTAVSSIPIEQAFQILT
jgi:hypothetical protein